MCKENFYVLTSKIRSFGGIRQWIIAWSLLVIYFYIFVYCDSPQSSEIASSKTKAKLEVEAHFFKETDSPKPNKKIICTACKFGENCNSSFQKSTDYFNLNNEAKAADFSYIEFEDYILSLPKSIVSTKKSPFRNDLTVGKMIRSWVNTLIETSFFFQFKTQPNILMREDYSWLPLRLLENEQKMSKLYKTLNLKTKQNIKQHTFEWFKPSKILNITRTCPLNKGWKSTSSLISLWFYSIRFIFTNLVGNSLKILLNDIKEQQVNINTKINSYNVTIHIRRGDACQRFSAKFGDTNFTIGRPCYNTSLYIQKLEKVRLNIRNQNISVKLVTDSEEVVKEMTTFCIDNDYGLSYLNFNRSIFHVNKSIESNFIETRNTSEIEKFYIFLTIFADLDFGKNADYFIGTSLSWVSRLLFFSIGGYNENIPSFSFIDAPFVYKEFASLIWWESKLLENSCKPCRCRVP